jgi:hypothetical protein
LDAGAFHQTDNFSEHIALMKRLVQQEKARRTPSDLGYSNDE